MTTIARETEATNYKIVCDAVTSNGKTCVYEQPANSVGHCPSGFRDEAVEARGSPPGIFCVKTCSKQDIDACNKKDCDDYKAGCKGPNYFEACNLARQYCDGLISEQQCAWAYGMLENGRCVPIDIPIGI